MKNKLDTMECNVMQKKRKKMYVLLQLMSTLYRRKHRFIGKEVLPEILSY